MRKPIEPQLKFGEVDPSQIKFDLRSRDETTKLLLGLQHIYETRDLRDKVFAQLRHIVPDNVDTENGRPGMPLWTILVLGTIRLSSNLDYDKLKDLADYHRKIREMIGHDIFDETPYSLQTLKDNVTLFTPEVLDKINQIVVQAGHELAAPLKKKGLAGKCDSFVVETNVHYPTDITLLFDAIGKVITLTTHLCLLLGIPGWRQSDHNVKRIKRLVRKIQNLKRSTSKDAKKKEQRDRQIRQAYESYLEVVSQFIDRVEQSVKLIRLQSTDCEQTVETIESFLRHAYRQIDQIRRRVLEGETIAHEEKVFSVFQEHTEWICKGKAGVPFELGLRVAILNDQYGFILHHRVMEQRIDEQVAFPFTQEAKERFPNLASCSYDKGFYSRANRQALAPLLELVILPKKGKLSQEDKERENAEEFIRAKRKHSAVESAINAIENHGLDRCPDHEISGFKRYVAIAVVARNLQILGHCIQQKELLLLKQKQKAA